MKIEVQHSALVYDGGFSLSLFITQTNNNADKINRMKFVHQYLLKIENKTTNGEKNYWARERERGSISYIVMKTGRPGSSLRLIVCTAHARLSYFIVLNGIIVNGSFFFIHSFQRCIYFSRSNDLMCQQCAIERDGKGK